MDPICRFGEIRFPGRRKHERKGTEGSTLLLAQLWKAEGAEPDAGQVSREQVLGTGERMSRNLD